MEFFPLKIFLYPIVFVAMFPYYVKFFIIIKLLHLDIQF